MISLCSIQIFRGGNKIKTMYQCDECNLDSSHSKYHNPAILYSEDKNRILHLECCSQENLINKIKDMAESEKMFCNDVLNLVENFNSEGVAKFEKKYGTYDEARWERKYGAVDEMMGIQIDKFLDTLAMIEELKKHLK